MAPPLSPCANTTTPSFPRRPETSILCPSLASSPTPPGSCLTRQPGLSPREPGCGGDAASAVGSDMCSNASPGQGCFYRGYGGVSSPSSSPPPPPGFQCNFTWGGRGESPAPPASWRSWHVQGAWRGSGLGTHRGQPSASFAEAGGPNRGVES